MSRYAQKLQVEFFNEASKEEIEEVLDLVRKSDVAKAWGLLSLPDLELIRCLAIPLEQRGATGGRLGADLGYFLLLQNAKIKPTFNRTKELLSKMWRATHQPPITNGLTSWPLLWYTQDGRRHAGHFHVNGHFYEEIHNNARGWRRMCGGGGGPDPKDEYIKDHFTMGDHPDGVAIWEWLNEAPEGAKEEEEQ